ncbi:uncharacterized protein LOC119678555 isoform X2 [Teleopsis dalmanni]|uniref:uncharacterized protein LOC119678555 isoform X2 n=1 Tax=Teleopsis dalmanni TaxID=139649 RepID=UPI0018CED860|nr:uncharacterized protein LOC119678555 isoform X2 [Teleopsis dalmanni]
MSQIRKSASFRSRIPVRRTRLTHQRCCSPHMHDFESTTQRNLQLRTNSSFAFEKNSVGSKQHFHIHSNKKNCSCCVNDLEYSSYSSSDESYESEDTHEKTVKQNIIHPIDDFMYVSTDAISLDGLLDTVSCGSNFSNPPSPVEYKNSNEKPQQQFTRQTHSNATQSVMASEELKQNYNEKQRQLSDWYYIKSKNVSTDDVTNAHKPLDKSNGNNLSSPITSRCENNRIRSAGIKYMTPVTSTSHAQSLPRSSSGSATPSSSKKWNNFDALHSYENVRIPKIDDVYNIPRDAIDRRAVGSTAGVNMLASDKGDARCNVNSSLPREYVNLKSKLKTPPYQCPPDYNNPPTYDIIEQQQTRNVLKQQHMNSLNIEPETDALSKVNVKLLKQQYQQQQQHKTPTTTQILNTQTEYANTQPSSGRRGADCSSKYNNNIVELQLRHWENISSNGVNNQNRMLDNLTLLSCHEQQQQRQQLQQQQQQQQQQDQQQQQQLHSRFRNNPNNCGDGAVVNKYNSNDYIELKQQPNCNELNVYRTQQNQAPPNAQHQTHPLRINNQRSEIEQSADNAQEQPTAAPRRFALPLTATPRPALRSTLLQKRPDETSCSSFEQLNLIGPPGEIACDNNTIEKCKVNARIGSQARNPQTNQNTQKYVLDNQKHIATDDKQVKAEGEHTGSSAESKEIVMDASKQHYGNINRLQINENKRSDGTLNGIQQMHGDQTRSPILHRPSLVRGGSSHEIGTKQFDGTVQKQKQQIQMQLQQNPLTKQLFGVVQKEVFQPKTSLPVYRSECELSGSYASLECPSPPGPPICLPETQRDPQARLSNYLRNLYQELSFKEPVIPPWAIPIQPGALCSARLEPDLRLSLNSHGFSDSLTVDQILVSLQTKEGTFLEAPRRCLIECPTWASRSNLCLRILYAWAKEPPWPQKGTPVALTLFIPLNELKRSFAHYLEKEILPKGSLNPFTSGVGGFSAAWNSLESLGPKLLIILDGYGQSNQKSGNASANIVVTPKKNKNGSFTACATAKHYPSDVYDLLDGRLFPEARVIITTYSSSCMELMPIVQRHIVYEGLTWGRSVSILEGGQWGGPSRMLDAIQESPHLRKAIKTPLGCLAVASIFDAHGGDLPIDELDVVESIMNCVVPGASSAVVSELGRLALFCIKMKRTCLTMNEIKMYCSTPDHIMGCLDKCVLYGKTAKKKAEYVFNPICTGMMEFLAANYIASLVSRPGLLAAEITGMAIGDELDPELLKVLKFAMALLGERAHILLSRLTPLWLSPQTVFTLALAGGYSEANIAALCDILGISKHPPISPLETKPLWVQVRSVPTDLMGWGMALKSSTCTLKNLEVIYQLEKQNLTESRKAIDIFLDSIALNESVSTLRLSSLIEMDVKDTEITFLGNCVSRLLLKPRLEHFELVLTLIEEDPPMLKLQPVVAALCRTIPRQPKLNSLLLDLGLSTSQLVQLCTGLEKCANITRISLPHLRCERGAISALSALLNTKPISFLSLPSCWGARDDPPSSSGVSMGSGSGSSTGNSCLIKQGSLPGVPSPKSYAPGIFSSLPRGVFVPQSSIGRSATLPRQPLEQSVEKRSCDSVVSKMWYPTPACEGGPHNSGTLHDLFLAVRESNSKLHGLDLSKAQLSLEDSMCLGETVRLSHTMHTLKLEGSSRISEILPSVLGASESPCLQMLSIGSQRLSLEDSVIVMCARALTSCSTLRLLSLDGWSFRIEHLQTLSIIRAFLSLTSIRELSLANCRLQTNLVKLDTKVSHIFESRSVVVLKLAGAQIILPDQNVLRGPQLLQYIGGFPCLRELDLSAPARSGVDSTHSSPLILDDKCIVQFFNNLHTHFGLLNTLKICNWIIHFDDFSRTIKAIAKSIRNSPISHLKLDGISVLDRPKKTRSESALINCFISSLPHLRWMGISLSGKKEDQITAIGNAVLDLKGTEIEIKLSESTIEQAKLMAQAISVDGKFDIKVSTFGTSSGILIHAEKSGMKSLSRKTKEKNQYF